MNTADETPESLAHGILGQLPRLSQADRGVLAHLLNHQLVSRDRHQDFQNRLTFGQRLADQVAAFGGSWTFIVLFSAAMSGWMLFNVVARVRFDPYPFILRHCPALGAIIEKPTMALKIAFAAQRRIP